MRHIKASINLKERPSRTTRSTGRNCLQCPDYKPRQNWCPILAAIRMPDVAVCGYGRRRIASKLTKEYLERKRAK